MLEAGLIVRIAIIVVGVLLCIIDFVSYCKQKLLDRFAFVLAGLGIVLTVVGAVPSLSGWLEMFTVSVDIVIVVCLVIALWIVFSMCETITDLSYKNQELAIQVSLLNCENDQNIKAHDALADERQFVTR